MWFFGDNAANPMEPDAAAPGDLAGLRTMVGIGVAALVLRKGASGGVDWLTWALGALGGQG